MTRDQIGEIEREGAQLLADLLVELLRGDVRSELRQFLTLAGSLLLAAEPVVAAIAGTGPLTVAVTEGASAGPVVAVERPALAATVVTVVGGAVPATVVTVERRTTPTAIVAVERRTTPTAVVAVEGRPA
ncbi:hypothetical protein ACIBCT_37765 [Streptosporangium sp. NPDC050855]|uniref:hypothetical protein n=1 Tax=Streptosporangium sp. NPDC050855 TaxID=3366194 RepID=UPI0037A351E3